MASILPKTICCLKSALDDAVSFTKGCYLGQEVVERIRSRGHVNKKLCGLLRRWRYAGKPGDKLSAGGKEVGKITSSVASIALQKPIALGYVNKDFWTPGTKLSVHHDGSEFGATVTPVADCRHSSPRPLKPRFKSVY